MDTEDARPFVSLKQNAEKFINSFNKDIDNCAALLEEKLTDLIRDPDSLGFSSRLKKDADCRVEFSKAKFNIFLSMKSHFDEIEEKWLTMITEIKNNFVENVEIFLAKTKLDEKFSSKVSASSEGSGSLLSIIKKQDASRRLSSSVYPFVTKVPTLVRSPVRERMDTSLTVQLKNIDILDRNKEVLKPLWKNKTLQAMEIDIDESESDSSSIQEEIQTLPVKRGGRSKKGTKIPLNKIPDLNETFTNVSSRNVRQAANSALNGNTKAAIRRKIQSKQSSDEETQLPSIIEQVAEEDITNELDIHPTSRRSRRKTMFVPQILNEDISDEEVIPEKIIKTKSKRKTMASISDLTVAPSPKRLKSSGRKSISMVNEDDETKNNPLDGGDSTEIGNYSSWIDLKSIDAKIPTSAGIYELKVWRAKKPAFIGCCENLRRSLTLHKLGQNSGHKHLDKFLERNLKDVSVRYEVVSSIQDAKGEAKNRIKEFVQLHKTTPAYN